MDNSTQMDRILNGMLNFNAETKEILDSVKNKMDEFLNKYYHINENPIVLKTLEQEYEDILKTNEEYQSFSAVGYRATLQNGDTVMVTGNSGHFFLNGEPMIADYTYTGDGCEIVSVWVFENKYELKLNDTPTFIITELNVRNLMSTPEISDGYTLYTTTLKTYNFDIKGLTTKKLVSNGAETFIQSVAYMPTYIEEIQSDCVTFPGASWKSPLDGKTYLKKAIFPNLTTINSGNSSGGTTFLSGCSNAELEISFPNLKTINNHTANTKTVGAFGNVKNVILPPSVTYVGAYNFSNNQTVILNCNRANFNTNWCYSTSNALPPTNFQMCEDWQASINIAIAAKNHTIDWFIDLFENKLAEVTPGSREISIPVAIYDTFCDMEESALDVAEAKGWIVGGI